MRRFAELCQALDARADAPAQQAALRAYFEQAPAADAAWAVHLLTVGPPRKLMPAASLRALACRHAGLDDWLFDACQAAVGDVAETIALLLPPGEAADATGLAAWLQERLLPLHGLAPAELALRLPAAWQGLDAAGRLLVVRLIVGGWRAGVGRLALQRALADVAGLDALLLARRLAGWARARAAPSAQRYATLLAPAPLSAEGGVDRTGLPLAFNPAPLLRATPGALAAQLGAAADWQVTWAYEGLRAQVVRQGGQVWVWSHEGELLTERLPDIVQAAAHWPDATVVEGELLVWPADSDRPAPLKPLLQRLGRKTLPRPLRADLPVVLLADELLWAEGADQRAGPLSRRRAALEGFAGAHGMRLAPVLQVADWAACARLRGQARDHGAIGLRLGHVESRLGGEGGFGDGRRCLWRAEVLTMDAVLVYAEAGDGGRGGGTVYSFAVWSHAPGGADEAQAVVEAIARREPAPPRGSVALQLLPIARAAAGLGDEERRAVDAIVRATAVQKFGPVRSLRPSLVVTLAFDGVGVSPRHKSGLALQGPRMLKLRPDLPLHQAGTRADLLALADGPG